MGTARVYRWPLARVSVTFEVSAASDRGLVRRVNEDSYLAVPPIFLVADGMGGHAHGDRASQATARLLEAKLASDAPANPEGVLAAVREANQLVAGIGEGEFAGTTLAGIALVADSAEADPHWMAFNLGDSRVYRWDGAVLTQLSVDHSAVQELVDRGAITALEAATHPERNVVTRAIGVDLDPDPDLWLFPTLASDTFLICSDGLTKELDDSAISAVLAMEADDSPADRLVEAALVAGGADNVTVVVVSTTIAPREQRVHDPGDSAVPAHLEETRPRVEGVS